MLLCTCCYFDNCIEEYLSNILSSHTSQTYVNSQYLQHSFGGFLRYAHSKDKYFGGYNAKTCNFPVLLNEGEIVFCKKEFIHPRENM